MKNTPIRLWAEDDRPREKLVLKGRGALSNAELLAIILGNGTKELSAIQVAQLILNDVDNDLNRLAKCSINDLKKYRGIGEVRAIEIVAVMELARRKKGSLKDEKPVIKSSKDSFNFLFPYLSDLDHEEFYVLFLNRANKVISCSQISKGGRSGTVADGKIIFEKALELKASSLILAHNHPSGQLRPSDADIRLTNSLIQFGRFIDIQVLDHVIFADNNYFSFVDEGVLNN